MINVPIRKRLEIALNRVSRYLKQINQRNKSYFNGNIPKHRFMNEVDDLFSLDLEHLKLSRHEEFVLFETTIFHHLENEWVHAENWEAGDRRVWEIIRTINYPKQRGK